MCLRLLASWYFEHFQHDNCTGGVKIQHVTGALYYQEGTWPSSIHVADRDHKYQLVLQFTDSEHTKNTFNGHTGGGTESTPPPANLCSSLMLITWTL